MLIEKLQQLAQINQRLAQLSADKKLADEKLQATSQYAIVQAIHDDISAMNQSVSTLRDEINQLTLLAYATTGNKKPAPGVGIRVSKSLAYDELKARDYCVNNLVEALKLDKRAFEKYANGVSEVKPLDFVTIIEIPSATIATDLGEYLTQIPSENAENAPNFASGGIVEQSI